MKRFFALFAFALLLFGGTANAAQQTCHVVAEMRITCDMRGYAAISKGEFAIPALPAVPGIQDDPHLSAFFEDGARSVPIDLKPLKDEVGRVILWGQFDVPAGQSSAVIRVCYEADLVDTEAQRHMWLADVSELTNKLALGADSAAVTGDQSAFSTQFGSTVLASLPPQMDDYDLVYRLCAWMADNCRYAYDDRPQDAASVLARRGVAKCEGLANLLAGLARQRGLRAEVLWCGPAVVSKPAPIVFHAIDRIYCTGKGWVPVDPTRVVTERSDKYIGSVGSNLLVLQEGAGSIQYVDPADGKRRETTCMGSLCFRGRRAGQEAPRIENRQNIWSVLKRK